MTFDEMYEAVQDAELTVRRLDNLATRLANILPGRLRKVCSGSTLAKLKEELRDFNAHTKTWK